MVKSSSQSSSKNSFDLNNEIFLLIIIILAVLIILFFNKNKCSNEGFQTQGNPEINMNEIAAAQEKEEDPVKYLKVKDVIFNNTDSTISIILMGGVTLTIPEIEFDENTNIKDFLKNNVINEKINEILNKEIKGLNQELKNKQIEINNYKSNTNKMIESEYIVREACPENKCPTYIMPKVNVSAGLCKEKICPKPIETKCTTVKENIIYKVYDHQHNNGSTASSNNGSTASSNNGSRASSNNGSRASSNNGSTASSNNGSTASSNNGSTASSNNGSTASSQSQSQSNNGASSNYKTYRPSEPSLRLNIFNEEPQEIDNSSYNRNRNNSSYNGNRNNSSSNRNRNNSSSNERRNNSSSNKRPKSVLNNTNIHELNHVYRNRARSAGLL